MDPNASSIFSADPSLISRGTLAAAPLDFPIRPTGDALLGRSPAHHLAGNTTPELCPHGSNDKKGPVFTVQRRLESVVGSRSQLRFCWIGRAAEVGKSVFTVQITAFLRSIELVISAQPIESDCAQT
ncbi:hypothetical protein Rcae01_04329 [Novipirellula caenicola]|uniref:Uncharacterized protein n=1 Tax=Novipirellula caenicola TaxID=1536901 RepID=A0ABP9VUQ7_9BACT